MPGVGDARVNLALATAEVEYPAADPAALIAAVKAAGFEALSEIAPAEAAAETAGRDAAAGRLLLLSAILSAPFLVNMVAMALGQGSLLPPPWQLALAIPVQGIAG